MVDITVKPHVDAAQGVASAGAQATSSAGQAASGLWSKVQALPDYIPPVVKHYGQQAMIGAAGAAVLGAAVQYTWSNVDSAIGRLASTLLGTQPPVSPGALDVVKAYASVMAKYSQYGAAAGLGAAFKTPMAESSPAGGASHTHEHTD
jgi:hypothetical protein